MHDGRHWVEFARMRDDQYEIDPIWPYDGADILVGVVGEGFSVEPGRDPSLLPWEFSSMEASVWMLQCDHYGEFHHGGKRTAWAAQTREITGYSDDKHSWSEVDARSLLRRHTTVGLLLDLQQGPSQCTGMATG